MRYFFAILSLVVAAVLIVLGIGQRTFLAGPNSVRVDVPQTSATSQYLVIPAEVFELNEGNPSVVVNGENVFFAFAENRDVQGWVAPFEHGVATVQETDKTLGVETVQAAVDPKPEENTEEDDAADNTDSEEPQEEEEKRLLIDPRGSDLWLSEHEGETTLKVAVALEPSQSVIVTMGEGSEVPNEVYVQWAQERNTPLAGPLLATGAVFGALGAVLYLFALDHDRRGLGPRRGRRGPLQGLRNPRPTQQTPKKRPSGARRGSRLGFVIAGGAALTVGLTACSPSYWPQATTEPEVTQEAPVDDTNAIVPVNEQQLERIISRIVTATNEADDARDSALLEERVTGPALAQRTANYQIRSEQAEWRSLPYLTENRLSYDLVQSTEKWPRTLFVTVESSDVSPLTAVEEDGDASAQTSPIETEGTSADVAEPTPEEETTPTLALTLTQQSPHENYQLTHVIELRGGIQMPAAAPLSEGTAVLANDIKTLKATPRDVAQTFASMLQEGAGVEGAEVFNIADDHLVQTMGANWAMNNCNEGLNCSVELSVADTPILTLSTGQGGALVLATITDAHVMEVTGERNVVSLTKIEQALGIDGSQQKVKRLWQHDVLFYVPSADSPGLITILGSSSEIVGATAG